jgi:hypothetical protein
MSFAPIPPQLGKLLPPLASNYDGEVVAAARAIERLLRADGHDFNDLVRRLDPTPTRSDPRSKERNERDGEESTIRWCFERRHLLPTHDRHFIEILVIWRKPLSPEDRTRLREISRNLEHEAAT